MSGVNLIEIHVVLEKDVAIDKAEALGKSIADNIRGSVHYKTAAAISNVYVADVRGDEDYEDDAP